MRGMYGFFYSDYLRDDARGDFRFVDVGANIGLYSLIASRNPRCLAIDAFEPSPSTLGFLKSNLERNGSPATVHPYAISSRSGTQTLSEPDGHSGAATLEHDESDPATRTEVGLVGTEYLSTVLGSSSERLVLKIDVEGHEVTVLETFSGAGLLDRTTSVWVEVSAATERGARDLLVGAGFVATHAEGSAERWDLLFERC